MAPDGTWPSISEHPVGASVGVNTTTPESRWTAPDGPKTEPHVQYHKDGTVWARGQTLEGQATGYWEWFRKNGVIMRSGYFELGAQVGPWTTYDKAGMVYKVTPMKPKARPA